MGFHLASFSQNFTDISFPFINASESRMFPKNSKDLTHLRVQQKPI
jgi:hypothetical protein